VPVSVSTSSGDGLRAVLRVSARADYAIRLVVALAAQPERVLAREALAHAEGMPVKFVDHVLRQLRDGGLITSRRGRNGGYRLARPAELISLADVVHVLDESHSARATASDGSPGGQHAVPAGWLTVVWAGLSDTVDAALAAVSIATLRDARWAQEAVQGA
jgi:Rrf2 family protein